MTDPHLADLLDDLHDLEQLVAATDDHRRCSIEADRAMLAMVELARHHQLAGRIVIQRLLPGLISRSARYRNHHDGINPAETVVASAWIAIATYDTARRQQHVAAALISDAVFQAFRQPLRRRAATEIVIATEDFARRPAAADSTSAFERLADAIRLARVRGVPEAHVQLVRELVQIGSPSVVAARRGVTPRTIRNHRDRAVAQIRAALDAA